MTKVEEYKARYLAAAHAMQTGVKLTMEEPVPGQTQETDPKHLRVGINSALVDAAALATVLIAKGVITEEEYFKALAEAMERDAESYRAKLSKHFGVEIKLG